MYQPEGLARLWKLKTTSLGREKGNGSHVKLKSWGLLGLFHCFSSSLLNWCLWYVLMLMYNLGMSQTWGPNGFRSLGAVHHNLGTPPRWISTWGACSKNGEAPKLLVSHAEFDSVGWILIFRAPPIFRDSPWFRQIYTNLAIVTHSAASE